MLLYLKNDIFVLLVLRANDTKHSRYIQPIKLSIPECRCMSFALFLDKT
jgi:hypothetical protein